MKKPNNIDEYINSYPKEIQKLLSQVRATIIKAAPNAAEVISYGLPGFSLNGMLVWFGAHSTHIGFYPKPKGIKSLEKEIAKYEGTKGSIHFPIDKPLPLGLITKIVKLRAAGNLKKAKTKKNI